MITTEQGTQPSGTEAETVKIVLIGSTKSIKHMMLSLHALHFHQVQQWSPPQHLPDGDSISLTLKKITP